LDLCGCEQTRLAHCLTGSGIALVVEFCSSKDAKECVMALIRVQYDAYNRQFKLLDRELAHALDDGETYVLVADVSVEDLKPIDTAISDNESALVWAPGRFDPDRTEDRILVAGD
jgi:hypothetical protein